MTTPLQTAADRLNADPDLLADVAGGEVAGLADLDLTAEQLAHVREVAAEAPEVEGFAAGTIRTPLLTLRGPTLTWTRPRPTTATPYVVTQDLQE